jgi:hypothetical protein
MERLAERRGAPAKESTRTARMAGREGGGRTTRESGEETRGKRVRYEINLFTECRMKNNRV